MITFPNQHDPRTTDEPLSAANRGVLAKYTRYVPNYSIAQEDVIPLVFETYGGYAPVTFEFLRRITSTIANNDAPRAASLMWSLRERIAVALHTAHAKVILALVSKQRDASADGTIGPVVGDRTTLNLAGDATPVV
jgi:hypothetical protein